MLRVGVALDDALEEEEGPLSAVSAAPSCCCSLLLGDGTGYTAGLGSAWCALLLPPPVLSPGLPARD